MLDNSNLIPFLQIYTKISSNELTMKLHVTQTSLIRLDSHFHLEMASFQLNTSEVARLEHKIKHCEETNIPI